MSHLREKRPPQVVVLLVLQALSTLSSLVLLLAIVLQRYYKSDRSHVVLWAKEL